MVVRERHGLNCLSFAHLFPRLVPIAYSLRSDLAPPPECDPEDPPQEDLDSKDHKFHLQGGLDDSQSLLGKLPT